MLKFICPDDCVPAVFDIDLDRLRSEGIRALFVDLDNTLLAWDQEHPSERLRRWIARVREKGLRICIVSNGMPARVKRVAEKLGVTAITQAIKPRKRPFEQALRLFGLQASEAAVVGDQLFTDILGGNRMNMHTILVKPVGRHEMKHTQWIRRIERRLIRRMFRKGLITEQMYRIGVQR